MHLPECPPSDLFFSCSWRDWWCVFLSAVFTLSSFNLLSSSLFAFFFYSSAAGCPRGWAVRDDTCHSTQGVVAYVCVCLVATQITKCSIHCFWCLDKEPGTFALKIFVPHLTFTHGHGQRRWCPVFIDWWCVGGGSIARPRPLFFLFHKVAFFRSFFLYLSSGKKHILYIHVHAHTPCTSV